MIDFEGLLTSYLTFLFLDRLKNLLGELDSSISLPKHWDALGEAYADILCNLGAKLQAQRLKKSELVARGENPPPQKLEDDFESEMHKLCAHFSKLVTGTVFDNPKKFPHDSGVYLVCLKKYGSPCHRFTVWFPR